MMRPVLKRLVRPLAGLAVTAAWLCTMAMLWRQEAGGGGQGLRAMGMTPEELLVTWRDYDHLMRIERNGARIGLTRLSIRRISATQDGVETSLGYTLESRTRARLALGGGFLAMELPVAADLQVTMGNDFEMRDLNARVEAAGQRIELAAFATKAALYYHVVINGGKSKNDGGEAAEKQAGGDTNSMMTPDGRLRPADLCGSFTLDGPVMLTSVLDPIVTTRAEEMKPGKTWTARAVNPLLGSQGLAVTVKVEQFETIKIGEAGIKAWRLRERAGDMETLSWYDKDGRLLRSQMPSGFTLERTDYGKVRGEYPDFAEAMSFAPVDRQWIAQHQDPKLRGRRIESLLPMGTIF